MKKKGFMVTALLILAAGLGIYAYPTVSSALRQIGEASEIGRYQKHIQTIDEAAVDAMIAGAEAFNGRLSDSLTTDPFQTGSTAPYEEDSEYNGLLNVDGLMGYIDVPKIDIYLPVYHGTSADVLQKGAGHLYGSALPVGGSGSHSVISAHRGLPSARMFTDLDQIQKGDIFYYHVLNRILAYQVDRIEVVEPTELSALDPEPEKDYMTLLTCTPYGINSHRLLVRGVRIPYEVTAVEDTAERVGVDAPKMRASASRTAVITVAGAAAAAIALLAAILLVGLHGGRKGREEERQE